MSYRSPVCPPVSIGVPVFNGARYLPITLDGLLTQSYGDFELIISDNASTDGTEEVCRAYAARDKRIRYFRNERNLGASSNYNRVLHLSAGKYFKWATCDDLCGPQYIEKCVEVLESDARVAVAYAKTAIIDETGQIVSEYEDRLDLQSTSPSERLLRFFSVLGLCNAQFGLIPKRVLSRTGLLGNYPGADVALLAELVLRGTFVEIPDRLFFRRFHEDCSSCNRAEESLVEFYDPSRRGRPSAACWRHHVDCIRAMLRAPLAPRERLRVAEFTVRRLSWDRVVLVQELRRTLRHFIGRAS